MSESAGVNGGLQLIEIDKTGPSRSRQRKTFTVEVVKLKEAKPNNENPYARFSTIERYETAIHYLAEIWAAISKRKASEAGALPGQRKVAA